MKLPDSRNNNLPQKYEVTFDGELVCIQEYADIITSISDTTHVMTYRQTKGQDVLKPSHIKKENLLFDS